MVLLNPQKLQAGFSYYYHQSIGDFITSLKMTLAANLLCTTEMRISDISKKVGYLYPSNFIKMYLNKRMIALRYNTVTIIKTQKNSL